MKMKKILALILTIAFASSLVTGLIGASAASFVSRDGWKVTASSTDRSFKAENTIDGDEKTYWHSYYAQDGSAQDKPPFYLTYYLPAKTAISGFSYGARQDNPTGIVTGYNIYVSDSDSGDATLIYSGTFEKNQDTKTANFGFNVEVKTVIFEITDGAWNYGTCAEFNLLAASGSSKKTIAQASKGKKVKIGADQKSSDSGSGTGGSTGSTSGTVNYISHDGWKVKASTTYKSLSADRTIDGDNNTYWHSGYVDGGAKDEAPFYLTYYLPNKTTVSGFGYVPRQDNETGIVTAYNIYVSDSDSGEATLIYSGTMEKDKVTKNVSFGYDIDVKTVIFEITDGAWGYGACAEFNLIAATGKTKKTIAAASKGNKMKIGSSEGGAAVIDGKFVSRDGWKVEASTTNQKFVAENTIDGDPKTYWHSDYAQDGSSQAKPPFYLTYHLAKKTTVAGFAYAPRQDNTTGTVTAYNIYVSDADSGDAVLIYSGTFENNKDVKLAKFGFNIDVKTVVFEITAGAWDYGSCAEFNLLAAEGTAKKTLNEANLGQKVVIGSNEGPDDGLGRIKDKSKWTIKASSERLPHYPVKNAIDGDTDTYWHTNYTDDGVATILTKEENPHWIEITLPEPTVISGFIYTPRKEATGQIWGYEFYVSDSDSGEWLKADEGTFDANSEAKIVKLTSNIKAKRVKFQSLTSQSGFGVIAEFDILKADDKLKTAKDFDDYKKIYEAEKLVKIPNENMDAQASSVWRSDSLAANVVDGTQKTHWHSSTDDWKKFPVTLTVDLGAVCSVVEYIYYPRITDASMNGIWLDFNIYAGENAGNLKLIKEHASYEEKLVAQKITFDEPIKARYFEFEILNGRNGYATCGELEFFEHSYEAANRVVQATKYSLVIGSDTIKIEENGETREVKMDVAPFIDYGYTQIPLRGLLEQMGATLAWDGETSKVTIDNNGTTIVMQIDNDLVYVTNKAFGEVRYTLRSAPMIKDSRTFVPIRFISEQLGYKVDWDGETKTVTITK